MRLRRRERPHDLVGPYALQALEPADEARFERHLGRCEECESELAGFRETIASLATATAADPPQALKAATRAAVAQTRQLAPRAASGRWRSGRAGAPGRGGAGRRAALGWRRLALAGAGLVVGVAGTAVVVLGTGRASAPDHRARSISAVLTAADAQMMDEPVYHGGVATVVVSRQEQSLVFMASGLPALSGSASYELWIVGAGVDRTVALLAAPTRNGVTGPVLVTGVTPGERLALSREPDRTSVRPTLPMLLVLPI
jgi:hypothetical protein